MLSMNEHQFMELKKERGSKPIRVMWLLTHTSARKFEIPMLKKMGIDEIFLPKVVPNTITYRSSSIDYSEDASLSIPPEDLLVLNSIDWFENPTREGIDIANKYFDIAFFMNIKQIVIAMTRFFKGTMILRAYGLEQHLSYSKLIDVDTAHQGARWIKALGSRFWFGQAYEVLKNAEPEYIQKRTIFLPLGLFSAASNFEEWTGSHKTIFFVCPDLACNPYLQLIFEQFKQDFLGFPYTIGGTQSIMPYDDPNILGFISREDYDRNMREMRVMFYHSREPRHLHYHPLEAIQMGMPLIFMAGGLLDQLGGSALPGRCKTISEARAKIKRILNDDWSFIQSIRESQPIILESISVERCEAAWRASFTQVFAALSKPQVVRPLVTLPVRKKIAVILPIEYRGGSLRGAKLLAQAIYLGSRQFNEPVDVVFAHLNELTAYSDDDFLDFSPEIQRRPFKWKKLSSAESRRAMYYAGSPSWQPSSAEYLVPDDDMAQFIDCDLWVVISDRLHSPLLPIKPCVHVVYDYIQRYIPFLSECANSAFINVVRQAETVLVTTKFTQQDVLQYAGLPESKVVKVPMVVPIFKQDCAFVASVSDYFIWTTNLSLHKNLENAVKALQLYYEQFNGQLRCIITGVNVANLFTSQLPEHIKISLLVKQNKELKEKLLFAGELSEFEYQKTLTSAAFLWHAAQIDNGTFSVIEAASVGVPSLSSDYPAMREMNEEFALNLAWMDASSPPLMAEQLKKMELTHQERRVLLPEKAKLTKYDVAAVTYEYWKVIRKCL